MSGKVDFKTKMLLETQRYFIMITRPIYQEDIKDKSYKFMHT